MGTGEHSPAGQLIDRLGQAIAPCFRDVSLERGVDGLHVMSDLGTLFITERGGGTKQSGHLAALLRVPGDAELVPETSRDQFATEHADRGRDRSLLCEDGLRAARDVIPAASGDVTHRDDQRLFGGHSLCRV